MIRIKIIDTWRGFRYDVFKRLFDQDICHVELVDQNPDLVISVFGDREAQRYQCRRMQLISGEACYNFNPNMYNYAIGDIDGSLSDTPVSVYVPHYVLREAECDVDGVAKAVPLSRSRLSGKRMCCLIGLCTGYEREHRKTVADGLKRIGDVDVVSGRHNMRKLQNDTGYRSKYEWIKNYKFNIAFENTVKPGYLTEKPFDAFWAGSIPIFYGDQNTFNKDFILDNRLIYTGSNLDEVIDTVAYYDTHMSDYMDLVEMSHFKYSDPLAHYRRTLSEFLKKIEENHA